MSDDVPMIGQEPESINIDMKALAANAKLKRYFLVIPTGTEMRAFPFEALNLISLYGLLLGVLPMFGVGRFCIVSGDGKELLADAAIPEMTAAIKGLLGSQLVTDGAAAQRAVAQAQAAMRNGGRG